MLWRLERGLLSEDELGPVREFAAHLQRLEPYPADVHPSHGDLRPQRLPAVLYKHDVPGPLELLRRRCLSLLPGSTCLNGRFLLYPPGVQMHPHDDPTVRTQHWRANVLVVAARRGGVLVMGDEQLDLAAGDPCLFRADRVPHAVTPVEKGERLVWTQTLDRQEDTPPDPPDGVSGCV